jgi:hypothetical protein
LASLENYQPPQYSTPGERNEAMATLTETTATRKAPRAYYSVLYESHGVLTKLDDGIIRFFGDDGEIVGIEPEHTPFLTVLGEIGLTDTQAIMDQIRGGFAKIACSREQGVS